MNRDDTHDPLAAIHAAVAGAPAPPPISPRHDGRTLGERLDALGRAIEAQLTPAQFAALRAALTSAWVTAGAVLAGLYLNWAAVPDHGAFAAYVRANAVGWTVTNLLAPAVRAAMAHKAASDTGPRANVPPAT